MSNLGNWIFNGLYLLNGACYDTSFYETHIVSHIWSFSWSHDLWSWMTFKDQIKVIEFWMGCISWILLVMTKVYMRHIVSHIWYFSWPHYLWPWMTFKGQIKYNWVFNGLYLQNMKKISFLAHWAELLVWYFVRRPWSVVRPSLYLKPLDKNFYNFVNPWEHIFHFLIESYLDFLWIVLCFPMLTNGSFNMASYGEVSKLILSTKARWIYILTWCFPVIVLITCKKVDFIESL